MAEGMPDWMRKTLELDGIKRTFTAKGLTLKQAEVINFACELDDMQREGMVDIVYDPHVHSQPIVALTEKGRQASKKSTNHTL